jgi:hypothetical protein
MKEISKETIEKISQTKLESNRKETLFNIIKNDIPKQVDNNLAIPSHRTRQHISFDEFKTLIQEGKTFKELCQTYSKHLMLFYNYLSRGQVSISKEQFEEQYNKGISLDEIARSSNTPREHITYLREYYGIKRKGANFIKRLQKEVPLSQEAKDIIIGSILGDGCITPLGYFSEKHSEKQVEYLEWKAEFLKPILTSKSFSCYKEFDKRYGNGSMNYSFCLRTIAHSFLYEIREKFYKEINNEWVKIIPEDIGSIINERILAIWFMDDGHTDWGYRNGEKEYENQLPQCKISSESFSLEDNIKLQKVLAEKYSINSNIRFRDTKNFQKPYLRIDCKTSPLFMEIIKKFITPELLYKIDEKEYIDHKKRIYDKEKITNLFMEKHGISQIKEYGKDA